MIKWPITYTDYEGEKRTENGWFHLSKTELMEMELSNYGMERMLNKITAERDNYQIFKTLKNIVLKAYGEKSPDGRSFLKSSERTKLFEQSAAFDELMMSFFEDSSRAAEFIRGLVPQDVAAEAAKAASAQADAANVVSLPMGT